LVVRPSHACQRGRDKVATQVVAEAGGGGHNGQSGGDDITVDAGLHGLARLLGDEPCHDRSRCREDARRFNALPAVTSCTSACPAARGAMVRPPLCCTWFRRGHLSTRRVRDALDAHHLSLCAAIMRLTPTQLRDFYSEKLRDGRMDGKTGGLSPRTVKYLHSIMREALQHAFKQNLVYRNVAAAVRPPKGTRPQVQVFGSPHLPHNGSGRPLRPAVAHIACNGHGGKPPSTPATRHFAGIP
jgi:hypothetical protein